MMDIDALRIELAKSTYSEMSDAEAATAVRANAGIEIYSRFGSFRTLASLLTAEEYGTVRAALTSAASSSVMVADMIEFLKLPGDEAGNGGGIDLGNAATRAMLDQLCSAEVATKLKAYAERDTVLVDATEADVAYVRSMWGGS
jgi:hypothetical protein